MLTEIHRYWGEKLIQMRRTTVNLADLGPREVNRSTRPGRPSLVIQKELLEDLRCSGYYTWTEIARMLRISRWTLHRRVTEYNLQSLNGFSDTSDEELDTLIMSRHGNTTGESYIIGFIRSQNLRVQRDRVRASPALFCSALYCYLYFYCYFL